MSRQGWKSNIDGAHHDFLIPLYRDSLFCD
jgi:hypothetical protein